MEKNSRVVRMNLNYFHIVSLIIVFLMLFVIFYLIKDRRLRRNTNYKLRGPRPYIIDKLLLLDKTPFAWRVGFTLSLLDYSKEQVEEFVEALKTVLKNEKKYFELLEDQKNLHLAEFLKLDNSEAVNSIKEHQDLLTSHAIMNDTQPKTSLDVVLFRSISRFIEEKIWKAKLERENMTPPGEAPF